MSLICPTVTANDAGTFNEQLKLVESFANRLHLDFMDGVLAPTISPNITDVNLSTDRLIDLHLMYNEPDKVLDALLASKPNLVIVHAEANVDVPLFATKLRQANIKTGLAVLPHTTVESVKYLLPHVQHILIFGGNLGYHGGLADLSQLSKVAQVRALNKHLEIAWDGGANVENIVQIKQAGVDVINVGSAIHKDANPQQQFKHLQTLVS